jgi:hypothetical protein
MKKFYLVFFLVASPLFLIISLILLQAIYSSNAPSPSITSPVSRSDTTSPSSISYRLNTADARPIIIRNYLKRYNSPLEPHSQNIVLVSDKYSLDYRLLVAIAQQESNLCKIIPPNSYNCWGFGIYGDQVIRFDDYPEALEIVARTLKTQYLDKGLNTPEEIMAKYTPPSLAKGGPWAKGVNQFLADLE